MIEYIRNSDGSPGKNWNPYTGCTKAAGGDFSPRWHPERLLEPLKWRKPQTVAVCFMGDLFGPGVQDEWIEAILGVVWGSVSTYRYDGSFFSPGHRFLFLTKAPENLARYNPWPPNAWVGITITGAETPERQQEMMDALLGVEGRHRWLSYEPMLGPLQVDLHGMEWLVLGAQSGKGKVKPKDWWMYDVWGNARLHSRYVWLKKNLVKALNLRQPVQGVPW